MSKPKPRRRATKGRRMRMRPPTEAKRKKLIDAELRPRYRIACYYHGLNKEVDKKIEKLVRGRCLDSGMSMYLELRDLNFHFGTYELALAAARRVTRAELTGVRVMLYCSWEITK